MSDDELSILKEDIDEEVLSRMPEWFRILRENYKKQANYSLTIL